MISDDFRKLAMTTANYYRLGMEAQGGESMVILIDAMPSLIKFNESIDDVVINQLLSIMFSAQLRKDYLFLADCLQYRLTELVGV